MNVEDGAEEVVEFGERTNACLHFDADHHTLFARKRVGEDVRLKVDSRRAD